MLLNSNDFKHFQESILIDWISLIHDFYSIMFQIDLKLEKWKAFEIWKYLLLSAKAAKSTTLKKSKANLISRWTHPVKRTYLTVWLRSCHCWKLLRTTISVIKKQHCLKSPHINSIKPINVFSTQNNSGQHPENH